MHFRDQLRFPALLSVGILGFGAALLVPACGGDDAPPNEGDADVPDSASPEDASGSDAKDSGPSCDAGLVVCSASCVNTQSDPKHCGGCNRACAAGEVCAAGTCDLRCFIDGEARAAGAAKPDDACKKCDPAISTTAWTPRASGETCGGGKVCEAGACNAKCFINGTFYAPNAANPANACEQCVPATSTTAWTPRAEIPLLTGGTDVAAQGWLVASTLPATLANGPDYVSLTTSTTAGARVSGHLLLYYPGAYTVGTPFKIRVVMLVQSVAPHNQFDSAAAILGALTPAFGNQTDRSQMIYLDSAAIGWADNTQTSAFAVLDNAYHTYELSVDAANVATVSVDGVSKLTRNGFVGNGTIAVGDQTNDANVDSSLRIRSVSRVCP